MDAVIARHDLVFDHTLIRPVGAELHLFVDRAVGLEVVHELGNVVIAVLDAVQRTLARALGVPLFEKNGRNVELTQFGEVFLKRVRQSLEILDGSVDYLHRIAAGNGVVRLGLLRALGVEYQQQDQGQRR